MSSLYYVLIKSKRGAEVVAEVTQTPSFAGPRQIDHDFLKELLMPMSEEGFLEWEAWQQLAMLGLAMTQGGARSDNDLIEQGIELLMDEYATEERDARFDEFGFEPFELSPGKARQLATRFVAAVRTKEVDFPEIDEDTDADSAPESTLFVRNVEVLEHHNNVQDPWKRPYRVEGMADNGNPFWEAIAPRIVYRVTFSIPELVMHLSEGKRFDSAAYSDRRKVLPYG